MLDGFFGDIVDARDDGRRIGRQELGARVNEAVFELLQHKSCSRCRLDKGPHTCKSPYCILYIFSW